MAIRITDTSTGKTIEAKGGKDAATVVGNVLDRQWYAQNIAGSSQSEGKAKEAAA